MRPGNTSRSVDCLVDELAAEGFYALSDPFLNRRTRIAMAKSGEVLPDECGRVFTLDAETLYESGPGPFLDEVAPLLKRLGAAYGGASAVSAPFEFRLRGRSFSVASHSEEPREGRWRRAALQLLLALDWLLEESRVPERCYFTHIDNDSLVCFATPRMAELLLKLAEAVGSPTKLLRASALEE